MGEERQHTSTRFSRRTFLKATGALGAAGAIGGAGATLLKKQRGVAYAQEQAGEAKLVPTFCAMCG
ncbi:MAG: twin-arginine translocation signal domain-containing protein, partial [Anaerolineae bacterium]|nr:twin-arginine translocation signal domain-containing protein [Anaerolineae bacterium]